MTAQSSGDPWPRVIVAMPKERSIPACGATSLVKIAQRGYPIIDLPYTRVDVARNMFAEHLLESRFTHLLMIDDDHQHADNIVEGLARWVIDDPQRLVISAFVQRRGKPFDPCMFFPDGNGGMYSPVDYPDGLIKVFNEYGPGMVGSGAILIAREVFERIPWPWFKYDYPARGQYPTEDVWFSKKCNEYGIDLWMDTTIECPHLMESFITKETHKQYAMANPQEVSIIAEVEVNNGS